MKRPIPGRTFFVLAYVILTFCFLAIHFTRVESFSAVVSGIVIKGRSSVGTVLAPPQIRRLRVSAGGLDFLFRKGDSAILVTDDGIRHPLSVVSWEPGEESVKILFSKGTGLTITSNAHDTDIQLIPEIPETVPPVRSLDIPLRAGNNARITFDPEKPGSLGVNAQDKDFIASLPKNSYWNPAKQRLNLVILDTANPVLEISDDRRGGGLSAMEWFAQGTVPAQSLYESRVNGWVNAARNGWKSRLDAREGLWLDMAGKARWDDRLAASILADAVATGQLTSQLQNVTAVGERSPKDIGWLTSPYLGNIVNLGRFHQQQMSALAGTLISGIKSGTPDFAAESALATLLDSGFPQDASRLLGIARTLPAADTANPDIVHRLRLLQEARELSLENTGADPALRKKLITSFLIPRIFWVNEGLWLIEENGSINMNLSIRAGLMLLKEAQWNNDSSFQAIGRQMVLSALSYADEGGVLPARLFFESDGKTVREGKIAPEILYAELSAAPAYPRHVSLSKDLGTGSWAITGAEKFTLRSTPRETTITMDYPAGSIHHLAIKGVKKFNVLYMNGIRWNGDQNFQRYYAGWYYDENTETLFIKIRHRVKTETIRILYYEPDAVPAPSEAAGDTTAGTPAPAENG